MAAVAKTMAPEARATEAAPLVVEATEPVLELEPDEVVAAAVEDEPATVAELLEPEDTVTVADEVDEALEPDEEPPHVDSKVVIRSCTLSVPTEQSPRSRATTAARTWAQAELVHILARVAASGTDSEVKV